MTVPRNRRAGRREEVEIVETRQQRQRQAETNRGRWSVRSGAEAAVECSGEQKAEEPD